MSTTDRHEQARTAQLPRYTYQNGKLCVADTGKIYRRPCDWAADCGPRAFLGGPRAWTPAARSALAQVAPPHAPSNPVFSRSARHVPPFTPLRGLPDDFLVFAVGLEGPAPTDSSPFALRSSPAPAVCGLCCAPTTLTVRFEDVWQTLPPESRTYSYTCAVIRDPHAKDAPSAQAENVVRESIPGLAPDARICLDLAENGGFVLSFHPEA